MKHVSDSGQAGMTVRLLTTAILFFAAISVSAQYGAWSNSAVMTINTTPTGADLAGGESVTNFPLAVKLEAGFFNFTQTKAGGADLRFSDGSGNPLSYGIELWDASAGEALIWVKIPQINGNASQNLNIHWGNAAAATESNMPAVFDVANGFEGVWHLGEDGGETAGNYKDATANASHGQGFGMDNTRDVPGVLGRGQQFDGIDDYILIPRDNFNITGQPYTLSVWAKGSRLGSEGDEFLLIHGINTHGGNRKFLHFGFRKSGGFAHALWGDDLNTSQTSDEGWNLWTGTFDPVTDMLAVYHNGSFVQEKSTGGDYLGEGEFGIAHQGNANFWQGLVDEVRASTRVRPAAWIKLEYESQKPDQSMVGLPVQAGCQENFSITTPSVEVGELEVASLTGVANCATQYAWYLVEGTTETIQASQGFTYKWKSFRVSGDSALTFRFKALTPSGWHSGDVTLIINESIPEPAFTLDAPIASGQAWNGTDPMEVKINLSNAAAIASLPAPLNVIDSTWSFTGARVYKSFTNHGVLLKRAYEEGTVTVTLCLQNGGDSVCESVNYPTTPSIPSLPASKTTDGKVKVFVMAGQSNMEGFGRARGAGTTGSIDWLINNPAYTSDFEHLVDGSGEPLVFDDVWVHYRKEGNASFEFTDEVYGDLSPRYGVKDPDTEPSIGPEYAFGLHMSDYFDDQVLLIKTAWGGRSLGQYFRPPGAGGETGANYLRMLNLVDSVTSNMKHFFPGYQDQGWEIAGLAWHQGFNDQFCEGCKEQYAVNLATMIEDLRAEWGVSRLPVSIGESGMLCDDNDEFDICASQALVPTFKGLEGNVVSTRNRQWHLDEMGDGAGFHWYESFYSMYQVGDAMGAAMVQLLESSVDVRAQPKVPDFKPSVRVRPDYILLKSLDRRDYTVSLHNIKGQQVRKFRFENRDLFRIPRGRMDVGVYTIRIRSRGKEFAERVLLF